mmetsp:Transcript_23170/g.41586  ORF Transcript_23170/g.41586 Transcript_23170/m.41586 type:complete len:105 (+) Transcript_23170:182-496(+)
MSVERLLEKEDALVLDDCDWYIPMVPPGKAVMDEDGLCKVPEEAKPKVGDLEAELGLEDAASDVVRPSMECVVCSGDFALDLNDDVKLDLREVAAMKASKNKKR